MRKAFLTLDRATFRLGDRLVFPNTTWTWHADEQWAVVGPNGSGKSLFAEGLMGRLPIVHGDLRFRLRLPKGLCLEDAIARVCFEDRARELHGEVIQSRWNSLEEEGALLVRDFLNYERVMEISPFQRSTHNELPRLQYHWRLKRALRLLNLLPLVTHTLISLSNGERQRVELVKALSRPTRLLILDEPFLALDAETRKHFNTALGHLLRSSTKVLLVTARMEDLPRQITNILCLEDCRIARFGTRRRILTWAERQRPATRKPLSNPVYPARSPKAAGRLGPAPTEVLVQIRNASVRYGSALVFEGIDWTVRSGESWTLLGPNGSGKSTLLGLIMGDHPQVYSNDVTVFGMRRGHGESVSEIKKLIGWVSPELQLHFNPFATCLEVVLSGFRESLQVFDPVTSSQHAMAIEWLRALGLSGMSNLRWHMLSPGQQRMVLLARAVVKSPKLLILDEPCQGLDDGHRGEVLSIIGALIRASQTTVIYVTHRANEIPPSIPRVLRLGTSVPRNRPRPNSGL